MKFNHRFLLLLLFFLATLSKANAADIIVNTNTTGDVACCDPLVAATDNNQTITINSGISVTNINTYGIAIGNRYTSFSNTTINNYGTLIGYYGVQNDSFSTINNFGTISSTADAITLFNDNKAIVNHGTIESTGGFNPAINIASGNLQRLDNFGTISSGIHTALDSSLSTVTNHSSGLIIGTIFNNGVIDTIVNNGTLDANHHVSIENRGMIGTITNLGTMSNADVSNGDLWNRDGASITNLNNSQGTGSAPLRFAGVLPTNYNIIVKSHANYGQLSASLDPSVANIATGMTNFGIHSTSTLTKGTYRSVLIGLIAGTNVNATSGMFNGTGWSLVASSDIGTWDLIADYSASNTLASVQQNSSGLATVYNQQAAAYQAALSYDCQVYDQNNLCVSVGGRYTYAGPSPSSNQQAGLVILGYKPVQTFRVGAFADQSVNISTPTGFSQSKTSPMWGFFAKWHKNRDETGLGVQASAVTSASSLTATRPQLFNTEAGSGTTQFNGQGYQLTTNYHQPMTNNTSVVPYLGLRYTRINAGAYTENTTATVTSPLSYNAMAQNTFSVIAGLGVRSHLAEKLTGTASVGIQQNLNYSMGNYAGTSNITGLESFSVQMPGNVNSMATATAGMFYDINKRERVGLNVMWQQQPFIATNTTTALATYTIGF